MPESANMPRAGVWDTVLEFGTYQHTTVDGKPVVQRFDASRAQAMLDDFAAHPESDVFYDKLHKVVEDLGDESDLDAIRAKLGDLSDKHALAWGNALVMVAGGQVRRYEAHPAAPQVPPTIEQIAEGLRKHPPDGVYCHRARVTQLGAEPDGLDAFGYTSPFFISQRDGDRLLNLTATNDPRMRGAALAFERGQLIAMTRMSASGPGEKSMPFDKEMMARVGMEESDSEAAKMEAACKYIRKMEDDAAAKDKEKTEAMGRASKMEEDLSEMKRKMEAGENPFAKKKDGDEDDKKEAMQAMQRANAVQSEQIKALADGLKQANERVASVEKKAEEDRRIAMERQKETQKTAAAQEADELLNRGQWNPLHAGGDTAEQDPVKRIAMTRTWLAGKLANGERDFLLPAGTFQPDERVAMTRMTQAGAGIGAPDPRETSADPDAQMDAEIARIQKDARTANQPISHAVAMQRVKAANPALHGRYMNQITGGRS